jgi:hypothetical protein
VLLAAADGVARETLAEATGEQAGPRLRSWGRVVHAAATLWKVRPPAPGDVVGGPDLMTRLAGVAAGLSRSVTEHAWPGAGPLDERFTAITIWMRPRTCHTH